MVSQLTGFTKQYQLEGEEVRDVFILNAKEALVRIDLT